MNGSCSTKLMYDNKKKNKNLEKVSFFKNLQTIQA